MAQPKPRISSQVAYIINECIDGVEKSNVGGLFLKDMDGNIIKDGNGAPVCSILGYNTFITVLQCYTPKNFNMGEGSNV